MKRLVGLGLVLAGVLYPFAVHYGLARFAPWQFALVLAALWLARALGAPRRPGNLWMTIVALAFCALLALSDSRQLLRWYPVLVNGLLLALFASSLKYGPPLVERLARLREPQLPDAAIAYTRRVTQVWCLFFLVNGLIAAGLTLWAPLPWWTLYNGLIAYLAMGLLFAVEWLARQRMRARS
ncbi:hypothetical protein [Pseudomonas guariconensis]|uniref:COG4648 family protein n=1 Tax=Pseudomonas guariconensis TaxID=1288410 RepID=UPI0018A9EDF8|nr:hypothetical protein [Pseudomonas guariconensis]MBF8741328.1 hypothetical protein [Pseudomonas guariconensis]MBF8750600.1 hypothetical protein [Pseudomonas guariconensis]MBF8794210.1 hypothetical protein [Pseudomonas monteilii]